MAQRRQKQGLLEKEGTNEQEMTIMREQLMNLQLQFSDVKGMIEHFFASNGQLHKTEGRHEATSLEQVAKHKLPGNSHDSSRSRNLRNGEGRAGQDGKERPNLRRAPLHARSKASPAPSRSRCIRACGGSEPLNKNQQEKATMTAQFADIHRPKKEMDSAKTTTSHLPRAPLHARLKASPAPLRSRCIKTCGGSEPLGKNQQEKATMRAQLADFHRQKKEMDSVKTTFEEQITDSEDALSTIDSEIHCDSDIDMEEIETTRERLPEEEQPDTELVQQQLRTSQEKMTMMREELCQAEQRERELHRAIATYQSNNPRDWVIHQHEIRITNQELGRGAWGRVFRGKFHGCDVAVKEMYADIMSDRNRCLFEREVEIASRCRHPCLLQFIGATLNDRPLLVTEIMDCSLRERLYNAGEPPLCAAEVSVISLDVAQALNYLHQKPDPIIHRDISSGNVLLWRRGNQWRAKVSDYGTANLVRQSTRNEPGSAMYSAPECLTENPHRPISCKVDVYSFGVLLCEMNTRQQPDPQRRQTQVAEMTNALFRSLVKRSILKEPGSRPNMEWIIEQLG